MISFWLSDKRHISPQTQPDILWCETLCLPQETRTFDFSHLFPSLQSGRFLPGPELLYGLLRHEAYRWMWKHGSFHPLAADGHGATEGGHGWLVCSWQLNAFARRSIGGLRCLIVRVHAVLLAFPLPARPLKRLSRCPQEGSRAESPSPFSLPAFSHLIIWFPILLRSAREKSCCSRLVAVESRRLFSLKPRRAEEKGTFLFHIRY